MTRKYSRIHARHVVAGKLLLLMFHVHILMMVHPDFDTETDSRYRPSVFNVCNNEIGFACI